MRNRKDPVRCAAEPRYPRLHEARSKSSLWLALLGAAALGTGSVAACIPFVDRTSGEPALPYDVDAGDAGVGDAGDTGDADAGGEGYGGVAAPEDAGQ